MKNKLSYTFEQDLQLRLKNPAFKKEWQASEPKYLLAHASIGLLKRLADVFGTTLTVGFQ